MLDEWYGKSKDKNGRKISQPFSIFTFKYKNKKNGKIRHENERKLMKYQKFQK